MRIHILTFTNPEKASGDTKVSLDMLSEAAARQGHTIEPIYANDCQLEFVREPRLLIKDKKPSGIQVVIVRPSFNGTELDAHVSTIHQFEFLGVPVLNGHLAVMRAKNKIRTMQVLKKFGIPMPKTYVIRSSAYIEETMDRIGSYPVVIKSLGGYAGAGVAIVESERGLRSIMDMLIEDDHCAPIIVQEYVKESSGKDIRVFVVGGKVVASMERIAVKRGEFRSNFHLGGKVRVTKLSKKEHDIAITAATACGLDIAGVDVIRTKTGPKILEVNSNPGLKGITQATGVDVAGEIIKYATKCATDVARTKAVDK